MTVQQRSIAAAPLVEAWPPFIDMFAGGGGSSTGLAAAGYEIIRMINHSWVAVATHKYNHRNTIHVCDDVRTANPNEWGKAWGIWMSSSCVHLSIARGGESCDEQERALTEESLRYAEAADAKVVFVENVKEILTWGPVEDKLDKNGLPVYKLDKKTGEMKKVTRPIKARKAEFYNRWVQAMKELGYTNYQFRLLNAADFGVPQARLRYYGIFTRPGIPIVWPKPTHDKHGRNGLPKWVAVREVLDLSNKGKSIFGPPSKGKKPMVDKSLRRILAGLRKHVIKAKAPQPWLSKRTSNAPSGRPNPGPSVNEVAPTQATCFHPELMQAEFMTHYYSGGGQTSSGKVPLPTITTNGKARLMQCQLLYQNNGTRANDNAARSSRPVLYPAPTITSNGGNLYLMTYYGNGYTRSLCEACPTLTTKDRIRVLRPERFIMPTEYCNKMRFDGFRKGYSRQEYVAQMALSCPHLQPKPGDSVVMQLLKAVCRRYGIADIFSRQLTVTETAAIMSFPAGYHFEGNVSEQKAQLGNAVCPKVAAAIGTAMRPGMLRARHRVFKPLRNKAVWRWEQQGELFAKPLACA
jgi:DNA (cytosine-5)-methyltransferase 1